LCNPEFQNTQELENNEAQHISKSTSATGKRLSSIPKYLVNEKTKSNEGSVRQEDSQGSSIQNLESLMEEIDRQVIPPIVLGFVSSLFPINFFYLVVWIILDGHLI
jgi:hypothetical protein